jgi:hypothetical protein
MPRQTVTADETQAAFTAKRAKGLELPQSILMMPTWRDPKRQVNVVAGKPRLFEHVDGNWPTSVFISCLNIALVLRQTITSPVPDGFVPESLVLELQSQLGTALSPHIGRSVSVDTSIEGCSPL